MSNTDFGYGQQQPDDTTHDLNAIAFICTQIVERLNIMKLVKVVTVHAGSGTPPVAGTVDVLPLVNQIDGNGFPVKHGTVFGLPYLRLQAGPWAIIADPVAGDIGYVICADRDSSSVVRNADGNQANPGSRRKYNLADGVYVGGILNKVPTAYFWLKSDGTLNVTDAKGNVLETSSSGFSLTGNVAVTGNITATGSITAGQGGGDQVGLQTHKHTQGVDSHGDTEQPTASPTAGT